MKAKRFGLVSVLLIVLAVFVTTGYLGWLLLEPVVADETVKKEIARDSTGVPIVDTKAREVIQKLLADLDQLRVPGTAVQGDVNMEMLGYSGQSVASDQAISNRPDEDLSTHVVSMAYVSGGERFAVIDGEMYQEGDELKGESGTKVRNITTEKVLIAGRSVRQWVKVFNPVKTVKKEEKKEEVKVVAAAEQTSAAPAVPVVPVASGGLGDTLQMLKNYSDVMNSLKGAGQ